MLNLLLLSPYNSKPEGGISRGTKLLINQLKKYEDISVYLIDTSPRLRRGDENSIVKRVVFGFVELFLILMRTLIKLISKNLNVIHINSSCSLSMIRDLIILAIGKIMGTKNVYSVRMGRIPQIYKERSFEYVLFEAVRYFADVIIVLDKASFNTLVHNNRQKNILKICPNAVDLNAMPSETEIESFKMGSKNFYGNKKIVLYVGWISEKKGTLDLLKAWQLIDDKIKKTWSLVLVGPGDVIRWKNYVVFNKNDSSISFLGELPHKEVIRIMKASEIFVLPSYTEGFPNVILEAMACSLAIIATPVGAVTEILNYKSEKPCGIEVPVGDYRNLARAIEELIWSDYKRNIFKIRARKRVELYGAEKRVAELIKIWKEL